MKREDKAIAVILIVMMLFLILGMLVMTFYGEVISPK